MKNKISTKNSFRILKGGKISLVVSALLTTTSLFSAPSGGVVTSGKANISQSGKITNINQSSSKASINWQKFGIKADETVNFNQPNANSITLNRVIGNERSVINGALNANGQVWILNSNGVLFGKNARVSTAGILATTKNLSDLDFQKGNYNFKGNSTDSVINQGTINIKDAGSVIFAANEVKNSGTIKAVRGSIHLVGADEYSINLNGNSLLNLTIKKGVLNSLVKNSGNIKADGGEIYLTTNAVDELLKGVVNNTGVIEANSIDDVTGKVELFAHGGKAQVGGTISATDGFVETSGKEFKILDNAIIKAGHWLIDPVDITIDDTLASTIETALGNGDVTIETDTPNYSDVDTSSNESGTTGNITVNSDITWSSGNRLTLDAIANIYINSIIDGTTNNGKLALYYGDNSDYYINGKVNLNAGQNFFTKETSDTSETAWTVVNTATDLQNISLSGNTVLGSDLDLSSINNWIPITSFSGKLDGLGHIVNNLTIDGSQVYVGLFGQINGATISNIGLSNTNITNRLGNYDAYIGSLIGLSDNSEIINSYVDGDLIIDNSTMTNHYISIGGLIGLNRNSPIKYSYTNVDMTLSLYSVPTYYIGNLIGYNYNSSINGSYSKGSINQSYTVYSSKAVLGGFIGNNSGGDLTNTYSNVDVNTYHISLLGGFIGLNDGTIVDSFYDKETSGLSQSIGTDNSTTSSVTGLTTAQMSYGQIYKDASWDIVVDSSVTSSTPILKYDSVNHKYVWAIAPLALSYNLGSKSTTYNGTIQSLSNLYTSSSIFGESYSFLDGDYKFQVSGSDVSEYKNAGTYNNIKVTSDSDFLTIKENGNTDGTLTINKKEITASYTVKDKTYDGSTTATINTSSLSGKVGNDNVSISSQTANFTDKNVKGDEESKTVNITDIALSGDDASNYKVKDTTSSAKILRKAINLTADNQEIDLGDSLLFTYTAQNLIDGDTLNGELQTNPKDINSAGTYDIVQGTLANNNYNINFTNGILVVNQRVNNTPAKQIEEIVTSINNKTITKDIANTVKEQSFKLNNIKTTQINKNKTVVASAVETNNNKILVPLSQIKEQMGSSDVRVRLSDNSMITLVNNAIKLPSGIEQEFYVNENKQGKIK